MTVIRRFAGLATLLLSVVGLILCAAGAAGVWVGKSCVDRVAAAMFATADEAFDFMGNRLDRVHQSLDRSRQRVSDLTLQAERMKAAGVESVEELEPMSNVLDEMNRELQAAQGWLDSLLTIAGGVNKLSGAMAMSPEAASHDENAESAGVTAKRVAEISAGVIDALARLEVMRQVLMDLQERRVLAREFAATLLTRVTELDARLASLSARIDDFDAQASTARTWFAELARSVQWWTGFAAMTLMLASLWFAVSQIGMMKYGWRFTRRSAGGTCQNPVT